MLTDVYSLPQLVTVFTEAQLSESEIEYRILKQVAHNEDTFMKRKESRRSDISIVLPYNGATLAFVLVILASFGLKGIMFDKSAKGLKVCKVKFEGLNITQSELLQIVHKIELVFHMAQHQESYIFSELQQYDQLKKEILALPSEPRLFTHKELMLLKAMEILYEKNRKRLFIKKKEIEYLSLLDI